MANGTNYNVPPNQTLLILQVATWNRQNLAATFTISATGYSETVQADASGRATKLVPSGTTYVVSLTHTGAYLNDADQTVTANSEEIAWVTFNLSEPAIDVYENISAINWVADNTYFNFPYKCALPIQGVVSTDVPEVIYDVPEAIGGAYAPVAECYDGGVYIWSSVDTAITIPTVLIKHTARWSQKPLLNPFQPTIPYEWPRWLCNHPKLGEENCK